MKLAKLALVVAVATVAGAAHAQWLTSYQIDFAPTNPAFQITNVMIAERSPSFGTGSLTWPFTVNSPGPNTLNNPFGHDVPVEQAMLIGEVQDLPGDAPGQKHIVLFMDDTASDLSNHIAWGTLFRHTLEEQLLSDLELATSGQDWPIIQPGLDGVNNFLNGDAENGILGPGGAPRSAWFDMNSTFTVMAFSDGQVLGHGSSSMTAVPEPATLSVVGLGIVALLKRRRQA